MDLKEKLTILTKKVNQVPVAVEAILVKSNDTNHTNSMMIKQLTNL